MPPPRPPSRIDPLSFPVFGLTWYGHPGDGTSIVAYCGGGGSAKTGVVNKIVVSYAGGAETQEISTGDHVAVHVLIHQHPTTNQINLYGAVGSSVHVYKLPEGRLIGEVTVEGDGCNVVALNPMGTELAVGCESGNVHVYRLSSQYEFTHVHKLEGHVKAVCGLQYALRTPGLILSSAKDGTAQLWRQGQTNAVLKCDITDPTARNNKAPRRNARPPQILVRGCAFGDLEGKIVYTVASGRKGRAFLSRWIGQGPSGSDYICQERTAIHDFPISAMNLSGDGAMMALGAVNGSIILFDAQQWKKLRIWPEVHELPVTCIAARPYPTPLQGEEEDGIQFHAISASADSQMAVLTLMRRGPRKARSSSSTGGKSGKRMFNSFLYLSLVGWLLYQVGQETMEVCRDDLGFRCFMDQVVIAPPTRPGILVPPH